MTRKAAVFFIELYQRYIRPLFMPSCRYTPSCSEYTRQAIEKYGFIKGAWLGAIRIIRCNPCSRASGYDPLR